MEKLIKKILRENRQLLKESCTCYTANPVGGGAMLVYDLCQQGTQAASCSCCCSAWLHPTYVDQQECLTTSVAPPSSGGDELGLYSNDFLTVDDSDTGTGGTGFIERDNKRANILVPKGGGKSSMKDRLMNEGPICGDKGGKPCGNCGDGYTWTDSYVTNSCICNHTAGAVCHSTGSGMYGNDEDPIEMAFDFNGLKNKGRGDKATDSLRHSNKRNNMKKLKLTETELIETIENIINEQQNPCIDPSTITYNSPNGVACLCFFDIDWSGGNQYGGDIQIEGCMQPNSNSTLSIYVNDVFQASTSSLSTSYSTSIGFGNAQTAIIRIKVVMECTGSHPACSAENVEKTICVRKSDGQKVPCRKTMPKGELMKHDDSKALGVNLGDTDVELESPYDAEDMRESRLESLIKKTLRETASELNEAPNCYYRRRNYANSGYACVARKCGFRGSNRAFYPGEFGSMDDCNALVIPTGPPRGLNTALNTRNFS